MISPYKLGIVVAMIAMILNAGADAYLITMLKPLIDEGFGAGSDRNFLKYMAFKPHTSIRKEAKSKIIENPGMFKNSELK